MSFKQLQQRIDRIRAKARNSVAKAADYLRYQDDPVAYASEVLKVQWWTKQIEVADALVTYPFKVLVKASHSVGKSHFAGGTVNWWYDSFDPGVCLTTAPNSKQVRDIMWKEVRRQRGKRGGFPGPKIPRLESSPMHFAFGMTANDSTSFQGQHESAVLIIFDEAVGVDREIWEAADSMVQGQRYGFLAFCNPTDTSSEFYAREQAGGYHVVHIPCLIHPNIAAELNGDEPPYPSAVRLAWLQERLDKWCDKVTGEPLPTDIEWPPASGHYLRPGPLAEARLLGRWPSATSGVWSDALWGKCEEVTLIATGIPEIGCDVARFGDDNTEMHTRCDSVSLTHESHNGWDTTQIAGRLKNLCGEMADWANSRRDPGLEPIKPTEIPVKVDDDGVGGGVVDQRGEFKFIGVGAGTRSLSPKDYPNRRSELWFTLTERAKAGRLDVSRLPADIRRELKRQAIAPMYKLDAPGRRVVEPKEFTKKKIGRSPDGMDAMNLAYHQASSGIAVAEWIDLGKQRRGRR